MDAREQAKLLLALRRKKLLLYRPYEKQKQFHQAGSTRSERCLLAANRSGKTKAASSEVAFHTTGLYPDWWEGRRFVGPTKWIVASTTAEKTMEAAQAMLLGDHQDWGTGAIPAENIKKVTMSRSTTGAVDTVLVKHVSGALSSITFKSYREGAANFASTENHGAWLDEEPPYDVYSECLTRLNTTNGLMMLTFTPKLGFTDVVNLFFPAPTTLQRSLTMMSIYDVEHFSDEQREKMWAQYQPWERDSILKGLPMLGEGRVYGLSDWELEIEAFAIPRHWAQLAGIDFGSGGDGGHPTAAVRCAFDRDADRMYVIDAYRTPTPSPAINAIALREWGTWLPWAWPHDGERRVDFTDGSSETLAVAYRKQGLRMLREHATFPDGGFGREAAVTGLLEMMQSGRFKVFKHLTPWFEEFRAYHRKDTKIVRDRDDLMSATEKCFMMRRHARTEGTERPMSGSLGMAYDPLNPAGGSTSGPSAEELGSSFGGWDS